MNNFLEISHQDGKIYFDKFRVSDIMTYPDTKGNIIINIDVKTYDGPYSKKELDIFYKTVGKVNNDTCFSWIELRDYTIKENDLTNTVIEIKNGYDIDSSNDDSIAHLYLGWSIELNNNHISFTNKGSELVMEWIASSDDVNYYDSRSQKNNFKLTVSLTEHHFSSKKEYYEFVKYKDKNQDLYFSALRILSNTQIEEDNNYDICDITKGDSQIETSVNVWSDLSKIKTMNVNELDDTLYEEIQKLCESGDLFSEKENYSNALIEYKKAYILIPSPIENWNASTWVLTAIGDTEFITSQFQSSINTLNKALQCPDAIGNAFIHLRLGQAYFETNELQLASDHLTRAYAIEGKEIFNIEDPKYYSYLEEIIIIDKPKKKPWWKF